MYVTTMYGVTLGTQASKQREGRDGTGLRCDASDGLFYPLCIIARGVWVGKSIKYSGIEVSGRRSFFPFPFREEEFKELQVCLLLTKKKKGL